MFDDAARPGRVVVERSRVVRRGSERFRQDRPVFEVARDGVPDRDAKVPFRLVREGVGRIQVKKVIRFAFFRQSEVPEPAVRQF